ncbi:hypothetical protein BC835DRAFT_1458657 [Cytidiella melzeri]|nr:hypothetical protein BC835DRAFT_1458657 [Cytidiella melzeri]
MALTQMPMYELRSLVDAVLPDVDAVGKSFVSLVVFVFDESPSGSDLYVGCSNGELLRLSIQRNSPSEIGFYSLLSRQSIPSNKAIDDIGNRNIFIYTLPNLDLVQIPPVRNVVTFAVDEQHVCRGPPKADTAQPTDPVDLCVLKKTSVALYILRERLIFQKEIPLPSRATLARRNGKFLCVADQKFYNMIDLHAASMLQLLPLSQTEGSGPVKPFILVINEVEFLILSWTGNGTLGLFIDGNGDPVRGTLQWPTHPKAVAFDHPHVMALMTDDSIQIHNIDSQELVQKVPAPSIIDRTALFSTGSAFFVPSVQRSTKLRPTSVPLLRTAAAPSHTTVLEGYNIDSDVIVDTL